MKLFKIALLLILISSARPLTAQWTSISLTDEVEINAVFFTTINTGFVVGDSGNIYATSNGGVLWNKKSFPSFCNINDVYFTSTSTGYLVGDSGIIFKTTNTGNNWAQLNSGITQNLRSLFFKDNENGIAVGDNGIILKTSDAGTTWNSIPSPSVYILKDVDFSGNTGFAVGIQGTIIKSSDGGDSWSQCNSGTNEQLNTCSVLGTQLCYVGGNNHKILKTPNGGNTWYNVGISTAMNINGIYTYNEQNCYIAGSDGNILTSYADDEWVLQPSGSLEDINCMQFLNSDTGFVAGSNGVVLKTINGGSKLFEVFYDEKVRLYPVPADDLLYINYLMDGNYSIVVMDINGNICRNWHLNGNGIIDISTLKSGMYFIRLESNNYATSLKFIKT